MDTKTQIIAKRGDRVTLTTWGFVAFHVIGAKNKAQLQEALHDFATTGRWQMETLQAPINFTLAEKGAEQ
mgnify:FL=1|tara:strand:- start:421 stop:630 length:210 start_codon:yes stop_codon:yes gene_type:complete